MLIRERKTGIVRRARVAPILWGVIVDFDGEDVAYEVPSATLDEYGVEIVGASPDELELIEQHGLLPEKPTMIMEMPDGTRQPFHVDFQPVLLWDRLGCCNSENIDDFEGKVVAASAADVERLRLYSLHLPGLEEVEEDLARAGVVAA